MSKQRYKHADALAVAKELFTDLKPHTVTTPVGLSHWPNTHLISIVGSLRRLKPEVSDVEILYVPCIEFVKTGLFKDYDQPVDTAANFLDSLISKGVLAKRPNVNGHFCWGEKNKLGVHVASGIPVDFFATIPENWFVSMVIRTGSKEMNLDLTMGAIKRGATLNAYGSGVTWSDGTNEIATSEEHVFSLCGVKYREARDR